MSEVNAAPAEGQEVAPESAPVEPQTQAAQASDGQEQPGAPKQEGEGQEPEKKPVPRGVQKRLDELTRQARDYQRLAEKAIEAISRGASPQEMTQAPSGPPSRDQFASYEEYLEAKAEYQVRQEVSRHVKQLTQQQQQAQAQAEAQRAQAEFEKRAAKAAEKYDDFQEVVSDPDLPITPVMADLIRDSELGPEVAYYLGKNPAEAERISRLSEAAQARAIGKLEATLEATKAKPSAAPKPIAPVGGSKSSAPNDPSRMNMEQYLKWREQQGLK